MALVGGAQEEAHQAPAKWPALEWPAQPAARSLAFKGALSHQVRILSVVTRTNGRDGLEADRHNRRGLR
jgi:hypothetical protein